MHSNLAKLEEAYDEGAIKVQFPSGESHERSYYLYLPRCGGAIRREMDETESSWLSEHADAGDVDTLANNCSFVMGRYENVSVPDLDVGDEDGPRKQTTELASHLVQDWTEFSKELNTGKWRITPNDARIEIRDLKAHAGTP